MNKQQTKKLIVNSSVLHFISKTVLQIEIWGLALSVENNHSVVSKSEFKHNFRGKQYFLCKSHIYERHKSKLRLLKLSTILIIKSYQSGKEMPAKANEDELL